MWPSPVTIGQSIGVDISHLNVDSRLLGNVLAYNQVRRTCHGPTGTLRRTPTESG
jgi:hypothetical protein